MNMIRHRSKEIYDRLCTVIPGGVNSPIRAFTAVDVDPLVVVKGKGGRITDADGREYIDFCGSWGALILGHSPDNVVQAVTEQLQLGSSFGIATELEGLLAQKICSSVKSVEKVRFVSSGTEATMTALRLARGVTGRSKIVKFSGCYHGHSDSLLVRAGSGVFHLNSQATSKGIPHAVIEDTICLPFNDLERVSALFKGPLASQIAAVILEPIAGNMGVVLPDPFFFAAASRRNEASRSSLNF